MADYSNFSYKRLLEFFEVEDRYDKNGGDSAEYLLSMSNASSIDDMIVIYNNVFKKIAYYVYCRQSLPVTWFMTESWGSKAYLSSELNKCLNENIERWYKNHSNPTKEDCIACIVNLRDSNNIYHIQNEITQYHHLDGLHGLEEILGYRGSLFSVINKIRNLTPSTLDDYLLLKDQYVDLMDHLLSYGYKKSIKEDKFEELRGIDINKEIKKKKEKKIEVKTLEAKQQNGGSFWNIVLCVIIIFLIIAAICLGPIGVIIILGLLGFIPKLLIKGK